MFRSSLFSYLKSSPSPLINYLNKKLFNYKKLDSETIFYSYKKHTKVIQSIENNFLIFLKKNLSETKKTNLISFEKVFYNENNENLEEFLEFLEIKKVKKLEKKGILMEKFGVNVQIFNVSLLEESSSNDNKNSKNITKNNNNDFNNKSNNNELWLVNVSIDGNDGLEIEERLLKIKKEYFDPFKLDLQKIDEFVFI